MNTSLQNRNDRIHAIFTVQHPAHVHLFRHSIDELKKQGCDVSVFVRQKDIAIELLNLYGINHEVLAGPSETIYGLALRQAQYEFALFREAYQICPDVMVAMSEPGVAHTAALLDCPSILFTDTEYARLQNTLAFPFADRICTPTCYQDDLGAKQTRYKSYHELAYLHPNRFTPDPNILSELGLNKNDSFTILRLNAWNAAHFIGDTGFTDVQDIISQLEETGTEVIITSEPDIPAPLQEYTADVPLDQMHNLMYYADLLVGESSTMAAESAVLGTPAIFISTSRRGYTDELGDRYGLVFTFSGSDRQQAGIQKAREILQDTQSVRWQKRREQLLNEKTDTTNFILEQINAATNNKQIRG